MKDLFIKRYSNSGKSDSFSIYINLNYPSRVMKIGVSALNENKERFYISYAEWNNIKIVGFGSVRDDDAPMNREEIDSIMKVLKKEASRYMIIQKIFGVTKKPRGYA